MSRLGTVVTFCSWKTANTTLCASGTSTAGGAVVGDASPVGAACSVEAATGVEVAAGAFVGGMFVGDAAGARKLQFIANSAIKTAIHRDLRFRGLFITHLQAA